MENSINAIDIFCGAGGLTHGLESAGISVRAGYDIDPDCAYPYEINNSSKFFNADIKSISGNDLNKHWGNGIRLLAGCAPCQPFSTYTLSKRSQPNEKWELLNQFSRLLEETRPELVTMENVPALQEQKIFRDFVSNLKEQGYHVWYNIVYCSHYGIPQNRKRLVLLASQLGKIELLPRTHLKPITVENVIGNLSPIKAGECHKDDLLHITSQLSSINLTRIKASVPGGTWRDWPDELKLDCHTKKTGERYGSVYGRMQWDEPAPTMTTLCYGYGNGRFGHPEQDRAISLREAAIFQTFPKTYKFFPDRKSFSFKKVGKLIGNAVPVRLGQVIGQSFVQHLSLYIDDPLKTI